MALEYLPGACVHSDSQYVVDLANSLPHCSDIWQHSSAPNFDLIRRMHSVCRLRPCRVRKVKAHQDPFAQANDELKFNTLGNAIADEAARQSLAGRACDMRQVADKIFHDLQRQNFLLGRMYEFYQEIHTIELRASEAAAAQGSCCPK